MPNSIRKKAKSSIENFGKRLRGGPPLLLDSGMGTELERRGIASSLPLWSARALRDAPGVVLAIHREEVAAGADIVTANTFRTHRRTLAKEGLEARSEELTRKAVSLAREAADEAGRAVFVLGSLSPLEDCYRPDLVPEDAALAAEHAEQASALAGAGVDGILVETHNTVRELEAAVRAARTTGLPVIASMVTDGDGRLLSGEPIEEAARTALALAPDALSINCVPARRLSADLRRLAGAAAGVPLGAYGNATRLSGGVSPDGYAQLAREWLTVGVHIIGGCCGTTAAHTAALRRLIDSPSS